MLDPVIIAAIKASLDSNKKVTTVPSKNKNDYDTWIPIVSDIDWDIILSNINTSLSTTTPALSSDIDSDIFEDRLILSKPNVPGEASYFLIAPDIPSCGSCQLTGGDFSLRFGVSFPSGDGPVNNEQGFPLVASSCAELDQYIADTLASYSDTSMELGYPIDWTFQYADGESIGGSGCENLPEDVTEMYSAVESLDASGCASTDRFTLSWIQNTAIVSTGTPESYFDPYVYCQDGGYRLEP
jgi:hypothetical protein